ncbi:putative secreted protein [Halapricum desulfuricans]|uniref:Putative secreted protein n=1 Tax=Halapricum desulfuricans TaxID=2841257 RepID=A0A897NFK2_9EURY|nr:hypothetical protein [Halapricum desulfuricans]QSG13210.1 putative secreted protein [Halapricum desulfuricans]
MNRYMTAVGVFVSVLLLTVGAVTVAGYVLAEETPEQPGIETDQWQLDNVQPDGATEGGAIEMASTGASKTVVVHLGTPSSSSSSVLDGIPLQGVDRAITTGSAAGRERAVTTLLSTLVSNGHEVEFYTGSAGSGSFGDTPTLADDLTDADAFLTTAPTALSTTERETVTAFADAGGRVFVGADPGEARGVADLGSAVGIYQETGYLYNVVRNDQNYLSIFAEPAGSSSLTEGVERAVFRGAAPIDQSGTGPALVTGGETELSTTQRADAYGVAAVFGNVSVVGDTSFLQPENAYRADNNVLIGNVADFLVTGTVSETAVGRLGDDGGTTLPGNGGMQPPGGNVTQPSIGENGSASQNASTSSKVEMISRND